MFTFHLGPLSRRARMFLQLVAGCAGACVLVGPAFLALARSPPIAAATSWTPPRLLRVKSFHHLGDGGCVYDPRLHEGPIAVQGKVSPRWELQGRLQGAAAECARDDWTGDVTISATIDAGGEITNVLSQGDVSRAMRSCLTAHVLRDEPLASRGPGTLKVGYFMGQPW